MTKVIAHPTSPNLSDKIIPVEFVVLHYTACSLEKTLDIFYNPERKVCSHFVIAPNGDIHDLGGFFEGPPLQAAHAGASKFELNGKIWEKLNECSIGIEIVNLNGNVHDYTVEQYRALAVLVSHLKSRFAALSSPDRIVGHEHIAGFRGKADPGARFDWVRFFKSIYGENIQIPKRAPLLSQEALVKINELIAATPAASLESPDFWSDLSSRIEAGLF